MTRPPGDTGSGVPSPAEAVALWQAGALGREALVGQLTALAGGETIHALIGELIAGAPGHEVAGADTEEWRAELLASRAKAWAHPASAGLLVGPHVLILTDGRRGVVLTDQGTRELGGSVSASMLLLCQTIVMADHAVDAQELGTLRQQRIESTSTSLSEIEPLP
ncbi:hypothetical protein QOL99_14350 [Deinococcus sp. MIMF12]|uniref:Roadblock/LC7 domain-containing protein n=1 Tax=Deinococcus rhizophilus TaxID=3049544 RepID=A0ABT7JLG5_9DEIO|nr:hypothetical protein [Deinococcus rhizophilus]MDL2345320.1 hypothetical protein [Deinococcus rhizophilus]